MNSPIIVSICCVTYNQKSYIEETIESFLTQKTTFPFEIIIHDDASTDGTTEIIKRYEAEHSDIIKPIFQKQNQYSQNVRVTPIAMAAAKGKYIALCEGDDYWIDPLKLQKQVDFLEKNPAYSMCFHPIFSKNQQTGLTTKYFQHAKKKKSYETKHFIKSIPASTLSLLFRSASIKKLPSWFQELYAGDLMLMMLISLKGKAYCLPDYMGVYRNHSEGISKRWASFNRFSELKKVIKGLQHFNDYSENKYSKEVRRRKELAMIFYKASRSSEIKESIYHDFTGTLLYLPISLKSVYYLFRRTMSALFRKSH